MRNARSQCDTEDTVWALTRYGRNMMYTAQMLMINLRPVRYDSVGRTLFIDFIYQNARVDSPSCSIATNRPQRQRECVASMRGQWLYESFPLLL